MTSTDQFVTFRLEAIRNAKEKLSDAECLLADERASRSRSAHILAVHACEQVGNIIVETWKHEFGEGKGNLKVKDPGGANVTAHVLKMFAFFSMISAERIVWYRHARTETKDLMRKAEEMRDSEYSKELIEQIGGQQSKLADFEEKIVSTHDSRMNLVHTKTVEALRQAYLYVDNDPETIASFVPAPPENVRTYIGDCTEAIGLLDRSDLVRVSFAVFKGELENRGYTFKTVM